MIKKACLCQSLWCYWYPFNKRKSSAFIWQMIIRFPVTSPCQIYLNIDIVMCIYAIFDNFLLMNVFINTLFFYTPTFINIFFAFDNLLTISVLIQHAGSLRHRWAWRAVLSVCGAEHAGAGRWRRHESDGQLQHTARGPATLPLPQGHPRGQAPVHGLVPHRVRCLDYEYQNNLKNDIQPFFA